VHFLTATVEMTMTATAAPWLSKWSLSRPCPCLA